MKANEGALETKEARLRRTAARRGLTVARNRARDPLAVGYGLYSVRRGEEVVLAGGDLDAVERVLDTPPTTAAPA